MNFYVKISLKVVSPLMKELYQTLSTRMYSSSDKFNFSMSLSMWSLKFDVLALKLPKKIMLPSDAKDIISDSRLIIKLITMLIGIG